jgi:hypothetical protein
LDAIFHVCALFIFNFAFQEILRSQCADLFDEMFNSPGPLPCSDFRRLTQAALPGEYFVTAENGGGKRKEE